MTEKEKMLCGEWFDITDPQLTAEREAAGGLMQRFNAVWTGDPEYRQRLEELLPHVSGEAIVRPPLRCDYGYNIRIGAESFVNFDCVMLDGAAITIGDRVLIGPAVQIYTFTHPLDPVKRGSHIEGCRPVTIGDDCWIGGGAIILPGVTIGPRAVVGAGSVVTKDVPADGIVAGNPARAINPSQQY